MCYGETSLQRQLHKSQVEKESRCQSDDKEGGGLLLPGLSLTKRD